MTLLELCYNKPDLILLDSTDSLIRADLPHYVDLSPGLIRFRILKLQQALIKCIENQSCDKLLEYMKTVAVERFNQHYDLYEILTVINILEESLWKRISEFVDDDEKYKAMKKVSYLFNAAKEKLISEYASLNEEHVFA